ncbi:MAG: hypothetical protein JW847_06820 [Candidatus Omnitrophica bacterium]|nr:hypothetical protein [Candidatus Omnitrophota bacterium]
MPKESKTRYVLVELACHLPYSIFGVTLGLIAMGVLTFFATLMRAEALLPEASLELFHVLHPAHVLMSSVVTTAMFYKHEKRILKAIIIGSLGSILICGLSDIFFPFVGGVMLQAEMHMHVCVLEHPGLIIPFALIGVVAGMFISETIDKATQYSHSAHVFISSAASILYLLGYGLTDWIDLVGGVFLVTIVSVMVPCCTSDIIFPLACVHRDFRHSDKLLHDH